MSYRRITSRPRQKAFNTAVDFLTAEGQNTYEEAIKYWEEGAEVNEREAFYHGFDVAGDWSDVWDEVGEYLESRRID